MKIPEQEVAYFLFELKAFEYFVSRSEGHLVRDLKEYTQSLASDDPTLSSQFDDRTDLYAALESTYPQYQRNSNFIMLFALFEDFLNQLSHSVKEHCSISISLADVDGSGLNRAQEYLSRHTLFEFPPASTEWVKIKEVQKIRNVVAHVAGYLDPDKHKRQIEIVENDDDLDLEEYARNRIVLKQGYLPKVIQNLTSFGERLLEAARALPPKIQQTPTNEFHWNEDDSRTYLIQGAGGLGPEEYCDMTLRHLFDFLTIIDELITKREQADIEEIENHSSGPVDWAGEYPYWWEDIVQDQLRPAFIILLMSATERHLKDLCSKTACILRIQQPSDGAKFSDYRKFLTKSAGFLEPPPHGWEQVAGLYHFRNAIAHDGGWITEERKLNRIRSPLKDIEGISFDGGGVPCTPRIDGKFCFSAHEGVREFFRHLHAQYQDTCTRLSSEIA